MADTPEVARDKAEAAEAAVQAKKDAEMKEFLTIPPDGSRPANPFEPPPPAPDADAKAAAAANAEAAKQASRQPEHEAEYKSGRQVKEEEEKTKSHTIGGRK